MTATELEGEAQLALTKTHGLYHSTKKNAE